jgi:integrase
VDVAIEANVRRQLMAIKKRETNTRGDRYDDGKPRYEVRLRGPDGRSLSKTFRRRDDAVRWEREKLRERDRGEWVDPTAGRITLREYAEVWQREVVHLEASTRRIYADNLRLHILPELGDTPLARLTTEDLRGWLSALMVKPQTRGHARPGLPRPTLSPGSVHQIYRTLHRVLEAAVDDDRLGRNPLRGVKPPKLPRHSMRFLSHDEVAGLAYEVGEQYRALVLVAAYCGLRAGELRGLRRSSIDVLRRTVTVTEQLVELKGGGVVFAGLKTASSRRSVPLPGLVAEALEAHLDERVAPGADALVFTTAEGAPIRLENFRRRVWAPACDRAGLGHVRVHDLRHTTASLAIAAGADVKVLQRMLGHASAAMTLDRYGHLMPGQAEAVAARLDEAARAARPAPDAEVIRLAISV